MPPLHCDFHIHTSYLKCANETMDVASIVAEHERLGTTVLGIADHLNSFDKAPLHRHILDDIRALDTDLDVYFGVELNFLACDGQFAFNPKFPALTAHLGT